MEPQDSIRRISSHRDGGRRPSSMGEKRRVDAAVESAEFTAQAAKKALDAQMYGLHEDVHAIRQFEYAQHLGGLGMMDYTPAYNAGSAAKRMAQAAGRGVPALGATSSKNRRRSSAGAPAQKKVKVSKDVLSMLVQAAEDLNTTQAEIEYRKALKRKSLKYIDEGRLAEAQILEDILNGELRSEEVAAALKQEVEAAKAQIDEELQAVRDAAAEANAAKGEEGKTLRAAAAQLAQKTATNVHVPAILKSMPSSQRWGHFKVMQNLVAKKQKSVPEPEQPGQQQQEAQAPPPEESSESEPEVKETWFTIMQKRKREAYYKKIMRDLHARMEFYRRNWAAKKVQRTWRAFRQVGKGNAAAVEAVSGGNADLLMDQLDQARLMEAALLQAAENAWKMAHPKAKWALKRMAEEKERRTQFAALPGAGESRAVSRAGNRLSQGGGYSFGRTLRASDSSLNGLPSARRMATQKSIVFKDDELGGGGNSRSFKTGMSMARPQSRMGGPPSPGSEDALRFGGSSNEGSSAFSPGKAWQSALRGSRAPPSRGGQRVRNAVGKMLHMLSNSGGSLGSAGNSSNDAYSASRPGTAGLSPTGLSRSPGGLSHNSSQVGAQHGRPHQRLAHVWEGVSKLLSGSRFVRSESKKSRTGDSPMGSPMRMSTSGYPRAVSMEGGGSSSTRFDPGATSPLDDLLQHAAADASGRATAAPTADIADAGTSGERDSGGRGRGRGPMRGGMVGGRSGSGRGVGGSGRLARNTSGAAAVAAAVERGRARRAAAPRVVSKASWKMADDEQEPAPKPEAAEDPGLLRSESNRPEYMVKSIATMKPQMLSGDVNYRLIAQQPNTSFGRGGRGRGRGQGVRHGHMAALDIGMSMAHDLSADVTASQRTPGSASGSEGASHYANGQLYGSIGHSSPHFHETQTNHFKEADYGPHGVPRLHPHTGHGGTSLPMEAWKSERDRLVPDVAPLTHRSRAPSADGGARKSPGRPSPEVPTNAALNFAGLYSGQIWDDADSELGPFDHGPDSHRSAMHGHHIALNESEYLGPEPIGLRPLSRVAPRDHESRPTSAAAQGKKSGKKTEGQTKGGALLDFDVDALAAEALQLRKPKAVQPPKKAPEKVQQRGLLPGDQGIHMSFGHGKLGLAGHAQSGGQTARSGARTGAHTERHAVMIAPGEEVEITHVPAGVGNARTAASMMGPAGLAQRAGGLLRASAYSSNPGVVATTAGSTFMPVGSTSAASAVQDMLKMSNMMTNKFTRHSTATSGPPSKARSRAGISEEDEEEEFDEIDEQEAVAVLQEAGEDVAAAQRVLRAAESAASKAKWWDTHKAAYAVDGGAGHGLQVVPVSLMGSKFASRRGSSNGGDQSPGVARSSMPSLPTRFAQGSSQGIATVEEDPMEEALVVKVEGGVADEALEVPVTRAPPPTPAEGLPPLAGIGFGTGYVGIGSPGGVGSSGGGGALASPGRLRALGDSGIGGTSINQRGGRDLWNKLAPTLMQAHIKDLNSRLFPTGYTSAAELVAHEAIQDFLERRASWTRLQDSLTRTNSELDSDEESETDTVTEPEELLDDEQQQDPEQVAEQLGVISDLGPTYALHAVTRKGAPKGDDLIDGFVARLLADRQMRQTEEAHAFSGLAAAAGVPADASAQDKKQGALKAWRQAQIASRLVGGGLNLLGHNAAAKRKEMERLSRALRHDAADAKVDVVALCEMSLLETQKVPLASKSLARSSARLPPMFEGKAEGQEESDESEGGEDEDSSSDGEGSGSSSEGSAEDEDEQSGSEAGGPDVGEEDEEGPAAGSRRHSRVRISVTGVTEGAVMGEGRQRSKRAQSRGRRGLREKSRPHIPRSTSTSPVAADGVSRRSSKLLSETGAGPEGQRRISFAGASALGAAGDVAGPVDGEGRDGSHIRKAKHKSRRHKKHKKEKMSESRKASVSGGAPTSNISGQQEEAGAWVDPLTDYDDPEFDLLYDLTRVAYVPPNTPRDWHGPRVAHMRALNDALEMASGDPVIKARHKLKARRLKKMRRKRKQQGVRVSGGRDIKARRRARHRTRLAHRKEALAAARHLGRAGSRASRGSGPPSISQMRKEMLTGKKFNESMNWMSNAARLLSMMKQEISTLERKYVAQTGQAPPPLGWRGHKYNYWHSPKVGFAGIPLLEPAWRRFLGAEPLPPPAQRLGAPALPSKAVAPTNGIPPRRKRAGPGRVPAPRQSQSGMVVMGSKAGGPSRLSISGTGVGGALGAVPSATALLSGPANIAGSGALAVDSTAASSLPPSVVLQKTVQAEGLLDRAKEERDAAAVRALVAKTAEELGVAEEALAKDPATGKAKPYASTRNGRPPPAKAPELLLASPTLLSSLATRTSGALKSKPSGISHETLVFLAQHALGEALTPAQLKEITALQMEGVGGTPGGAGAVQEPHTSPAVPGAWHPGPRESSVLAPRQSGDLAVGGTNPIHSSTASVLDSTTGGGKDRRAHSHTGMSLAAMLGGKPGGELAAESSWASSVATASGVGTGTDSGGGHPSSSTVGGVGTARDIEGARRRAAYVRRAVVHQPPRQALAALAVAKRSALLGLAPPQLAHHESIGPHRDLHQQAHAHPASQQQHPHQQQQDRTGMAGSELHQLSQNNGWGLQGHPVGKESSLVMELQALAEEGHVEAEGVDGEQPHEQEQEHGTASPEPPTALSTKPSHKSAKSHVTAGSTRVSPSALADAADLVAAARAEPDPGQRTQLLAEALATGVPLVTLVELARGPHGHWSSPWVSHLHEQQVIAAAVHSGDKQGLEHLTQVLRETAEAAAHAQAQYQAHAQAASAATNPFSPYPYADAQGYVNQGYAGGSAFIAGAGPSEEIPMSHLGASQSVGNLHPPVPAESASHSDTPMTADEDPFRVTSQLLRGGSLRLQEQRSSSTGAGTAALQDAPWMVGEGVHDMHADNSVTSEGVPPWQRGPRQQREMSYDGRSAMLSRLLASSAAPGSGSGRFSSHSLPGNSHAHAAAAASGHSMSYSGSLFSHSVTQPRGSADGRGSQMSRMLAVATGDRRVSEGQAADADSGDGRLEGIDEQQSQGYVDPQDASQRGYSHSGADSVVQPATEEVWQQLEPVASDAEDNGAEQQEEEQDQQQYAAPTGSTNGTAEKDKQSWGWGGVAIQPRGNQGRGAAPEHHTSYPGIARAPAAANGSMWGADPDHPVASSYPGAGLLAGPGAGKRGMRHQGSSIVHASPFVAPVPDEQQLQYPSDNGSALQDPQHYESRRPSEPSQPVDPDEPQTFWGRPPGSIRSHPLDHIDSPTQLSAPSSPLAHVNSRKRESVDSFSAVGVAAGNARGSTTGMGLGGTGVGGTSMGARSRLSGMATSNTTGPMGAVQGSFTNGSASGAAAVAGGLKVPAPVRIRAAEGRGAMSADNTPTVAAAALTHQLPAIRSPGSFRGSTAAPYSPTAAVQLPPLDRKLSVPVMLAGAAGSTAGTSTALGPMPAWRQGPEDLTTMMQSSLSRMDTLLVRRLSRPGPKEPQSSQETHISAGAADPASNPAGTGAGATGGSSALESAANSDTFGNQAADLATGAASAPDSPSWLAGGAQGTNEGAAQKQTAKAALRSRAAQKERHATETAMAAAAAASQDVTAKLAALFTHGPKAPALQSRFSQPQVHAGQYVGGHGQYNAAHHAAPGRVSPPLRHQTSLPALSPHKAVSSPTHLGPSSPQPHRHHSAHQRQQPHAGGHVVPGGALKEPPIVLPPEALDMLSKQQKLLGRSQSAVVREAREELEVAQRKKQQLRELQEAAFGYKHPTLSAEESGAGPWLVAQDSHTSDSLPVSHRSPPRHHQPSRPVVLPGPPGKESSYRSLTDEKEREAKVQQAGELASAVAVRAAAAAAERGITTPSAAAAGAAAAARAVALAQARQQQQAAQESHAQSARESRAENSSASVGGGGGGRGGGPRPAVHKGVPAKVGHMDPSMLDQLIHAAEAGAHAALSKRNATNAEANAISPVRAIISGRPSVATNLHSQHSQQSDVSG